MTDIAAMLNSYPAALDGLDLDRFIVCVQECHNAAQVCTICADACLVDTAPADLARCAAAALDCADQAGTTARVVSRRAGYDAALVTAVLKACIETCRVCYDECRKHALEHEHCRICAEACRRCAQSCRALLTALA